MVWVGFLSVRNTSTDLQISGNLREVMMLRQAAEGALQKMNGLCNLNPTDFARASDSLAVGPSLVTDAFKCTWDTSVDPHVGTCALDPKFTGMKEFKSLPTTFTPTLDAEQIRGAYNFRVSLSNHGAPMQIALSDQDFCMQKYDVLVRASTPGSAAEEQFTARSTLTVQPVPCR